jgi:hypothetical protein
MALAMAGCGVDELLYRQPVSGFVTVDGRPLARGVINIWAHNANDLDIDVQNAGGPIKNGYFSIPRSDGPVPGTYWVSINVDPGRKRPRDEREGPGEQQIVEKEAIPRKYNVETCLRLEINDKAIKEAIFALESK